MRKSITIRSELIELIQQERNSILQEYRIRRQRWDISSFEDRDRYDLGKIVAIEDEELFLERLEDYVKSLWIKRKIKLWN